MLFKPIVSAIVEPLKVLMFDSNEEIMQPLSLELMLEAEKMFYVFQHGRGFERRLLWLLWKRNR